MPRFNLDKYYATEIIRRELFDPLKQILGYYIRTVIEEILEPSAGNKALEKEISEYQKSAIYMDIEPEAEGIIKQSFYDWNPAYKKRLIVGGPPFSKKNFYKFLNHCQKNKADIIAFICPASAFNRLYFQKDYKLLYSKLLGSQIFIGSNGEEHPVSVCINIWIREEGFVPPIDLFDELMKKDFDIKTFRIPSGRVLDFEFNLCQRGFAGRLTNPMDFKVGESYIGINLLNKDLRNHFLQFLSGIESFDNYIKKRSTSYPYLSKTLFKQHLKENFYYFRTRLYPMSLDLFKFKHRRLVDLGVIRFHKSFGQEYVYIDRWDPKYHIFLCENKELTSVYTDLKKLNFISQGFGLGEYIKAA